ncbi:MAG TPA: nucleotidyltransferase family protein [Bryobacteraceae bacterium]|nr:nucleotidyltransferase family protein [Bryobacteraceae bacterium]
MQAVILAGGLGTRLLPLTESVPKPMVPVAGRPYLEHQIELLRQQGIDDVLLLTGYLGEQIQRHFADGWKHGVRIRYSREREPLGTGGALLLAMPLLQDSFLVLNGDSYLPADYKRITALLQDAPMGLAVYDNRLGDTGVANNIGLDGDGRVALYRKGAGAAATHVDAGAVAMRRDALAHAPAGRFSLESDLFPLLIARRELAAWPSPERFYDMGTPAGLVALESYLQRR